MILPYFCADDFSVLAGGGGVPAECMGGTLSRMFECLSLGCYSARLLSNKLYWINALSSYCTYQTLWTCFLCYLPRMLYGEWRHHATFLGPVLIPVPCVNPFNGYHNQLEPALLCFLFYIQTPASLFGWYSAHQKKVLAGIKS
jgi:hypothetical protein